LPYLDSNKKGFTLLELLLSVAILAVLFSYLYMNFYVAKNSTDATKAFREKELFREKVSTLLYNDLILSTKITPTAGEEEYDTLDIIGTNSLHNITAPYIKYTVIDSTKAYSENNGSILVRLESNAPINTKARDRIFYLDEVANNVEYFKIVTYDKYAEYFLKIKNQKPIHFKLFLGPR